MRFVWMGKGWFEKPAFPAPHDESRMLKNLLQSRIKKTWLVGERGFTFVEIILTTVLLSMGMWGAFAIFQNVSSNTLQNDMRVIASQLASEKIEAILADKAFNGYNWIDENNYPDEVLAAPYDNFTRSVTVTEVDGNDFVTPEPGSGYKRVDIQVTWGNEAFETLTVSTLVTNYS